jgi:hypothetical protein
MKKLIVSNAAILFGIIALTSYVYARNEVSQDWVTQNLASMPLAFTRNTGQWDEQALFRADAGVATVWITTEGVYYEFARRIQSDGNPPQAVGHPDSGRQMSPSAPNDMDDSVGRNPRDLDNESDSLETMVLKATLVGANPNPTMSGDNPMDYKCNYFLGNDPSGWRIDVPNYQAVLLEEVYPGIDLAYYGNGRQMEYDFRVSTGADYSRIKIRYEGAEGLAIANDGALIVTTKWGEVKELAPVVYQTVGSSRKPVTAGYEVLPDHTFGFRLGPEFDPSLPVVIDPVLVYSTYLGGSLNDASRGIAVDASGSVYVTGETFSTNFPTLNASQSTQSGYFNVFVTKLSKAGNSLIYSTYLGGSVTDAGDAIAVDSSGAVYVTGSASSSDFPTVDAYQRDYAGGTSDAIVFKLSKAGNTLVYSTFLGGSDWDNSDDIAVDASGAAYVTGYTSSNNFPIRNAYQGTNQGDFDVFVTKLSSRGNSLVYSTYLGGSGADDGNSIAVDASGAAYVTGRTQSPNFPTLNAFQGTLQGQYLDAFVTKLSSTGTSLIYSTFLGGFAEDYGYGIVVDISGAAYVTGKTVSTDFPTYNAYQGTKNGAYDAFVTKLTSTGNSLIYSTFLGGTADDYGLGIAIDASGAAYVTGRAFSTNFPTLNAYQGTYQGGFSDAFVSKISGAGNSIVYSTYLGGVGYDGCTDIAVEASGAVYVTGYTDSDNFPVPSLCHGTSPQGEADAFVIKLIETLGPDQDGDGVPDATDNCPNRSNPCQEDINNDGTGNACCCALRVGNANGLGTYPQEITISDIQTLVTAKFIQGTCVGILSCPAEGDVNQSGGANPTCNDITISDISTLVNHLFIAGPANAPLKVCL